MIGLASVVAGALILAQGAAIWGFLRFVKSFGAYTATQQQMVNALLYTHESNLMIHESNLRIIEEIRKTQVSLTKREVA